MNDNITFFIDTLNILPLNTECLIQAPSLDNIFFLSLMSETDYNYYKSIHLDNEHKMEIINILKKYPIIDYFQKIEIRDNKSLLFEGFDGLDFGIFSKNINIPDWFRNKYSQDEMYIISSDW